jgi:NAD(P)-dependent dehydrogenase (short-subunit alcohol dehydrogenase family)
VSDRPSVIVTGGGTGIGFASAVALHRSGFDVTIAGRRAGVLAEAADAIREAGGTGEIAVQAVDLAQPDASHLLVSEHVEHFGGVDALVAAAGAYELVGTLDVSAEAWDRTTDVHVRAAVLCASAAARHMTAAGHGRIVLISSVNGFTSEPDSIAYSAAKAAIISLARSLAVDLGRFGVTTNAVAPGWVWTPMTQEYLADSNSESLLRVNPLGRAGQADEIAEVIRWLVVDAPQFLTGATIAVDGGQTALAPIP